jgi:hypothetical protein
VGLDRAPRRSRSARPCTPQNIYKLLYPTSGVQEKASRRDQGFKRCRWRRQVWKQGGVFDQLAVNVSGNGKKVGAGVTGETNKCLGHVFGSKQLVGLRSKIGEKDSYFAKSCR